MPRRPFTGPSAAHRLRVWLVALVSLALLSAWAIRNGSKAAEEQPMIFDSAFEEGLQGWQEQGDAQFAVSSEQPHGGGQCARIVVVEGAELRYQQLFREFGPVQPGDEFRVTAWVRTEGVADGTGAYTALQFLDGASQRVGIEHSKLSVNNGRAGWEELVIEGKAPKGTEKGRVDLILNSHGTAWFDDVRVAQTGRLEPWPDLGSAEREVTVHTDEVLQPNFVGVGFHVFHHVHPISQTFLETVVAKRWREIDPSFARLNDQWNWDQATLDKVAAHLLRFKQTGTEIYMTTWGPQDTQPGEERASYAKRVVDNLEYLVRTKGCTNIKWYCMTNELTLGSWGTLIDDLPKFKDYHQHLYDELKARNLDIKLLATDASPIQRWNSIEWATENMDGITGAYGGHHYFNNHAPDDERFYPWFLPKLEWGVGLATAKGKPFIMGEFGCKQDGRTIDGVKRDVCIYWDTPDEPMVGIQLAEAAIAALNAGAYALGNWTFMDFPDEYNRSYINKWGTFKWTGNDYSTRAHYYGYGLLTKFCRGRATVFKVDCSDPYVRVAALQHHGTDTYSIAVVNRYQGDVPLDIRLEEANADADFRKYVYDPQNVPFHPHGDLQGPAGKVPMRDGRLTDTVGAGMLVVYTTAYDEEPPAPVTGLKVEKADAGVRLAWDPSPEPDLCYYRVYCGESADFQPTVEAQTGSTIATEFLHERQGTEGRSHYKVVAVDQSGNASISTTQGGNR